MLWAPRSLCIRGSFFSYSCRRPFFFFFFFFCLLIFFPGGNANSGGGGADASIGPRALETLGTPLHLGEQSVCHKKCSLVSLSVSVDVLNLTGFDPTIWNTPQEGCSWSGIKAGSSVGHLLGHVLWVPLC